MTGSSASAPEHVNLQSLQVMVVLQAPHVHMWVGGEATLQLNDMHVPTPHSCLCLATEYLMMHITRLGAIVACKQSAMTSVAPLQQHLCPVKMGYMLKQERTFRPVCTRGSTPTPRGVNVTSKTGCCR